MAEKEHLNPAGLYEPAGYTHVIAARGQRLIFISGQIPFNAQGELVGRGDLRAQAEQVFENLAVALAAVDAGFADVVKVTTYVVADMAMARPILTEIRSRRLAGAKPPASTLVSVPGLALEGLLVEIEAVAITD